MDTTYIIALAIGILFIILSTPMIMKKIRPNQWYGFRTKRTLSNEKIWYKANKFSGWLLLLSGILIFTLSLILANTKNPEQYQNYIWIIILAPVVLMTIFSFVYLKRI